MVRNPLPSQIKICTHMYMFHEKRILLNMPIFLKYVFHSTYFYRNTLLPSSTSNRGIYRCLFSFYKLFFANRSSVNCWGGTSESVSVLQVCGSPTNNDAEKWMRALIWCRAERAGTRTPLVSAGRRHPARLGRHLNTAATSCYAASSSAQRSKVKRNRSDQCRLSILYPGIVSMLSYHQSPWELLGVDRWSAISQIESHHTSFH
jgi:hypothetical protein